MASITIKTVAGKAAGNLELPADVFGIQPNVPVLHQVVTAQLAARRAGTQSTKTRAEVSGGGKKPFKQKGTGNARQGSTRSPHFSGGGVALGPKPRKYDQRTPKKMIKLALRSALSDRAAEGKIIVVDDWGFAAPKTKAAKAALSSLGIEGKALVVVDRDDENTIKSFLNLREVQLIERAELNAYDILCNEYIVFSKATLPNTDAAAPLAAVADVAVADVAAPAAKPAAAKKAAAKPAAAKKAAAPKPETDAAPAAVPAELPTGAVAGNADGSAPDGHEIKGNGDSGLYHVPGSRFYKQTVAEFWFATAEAAEAAGFQLPPSQRDSADEDPS
ncbi:MAG: 50S ribosomal protein L4 [Actinomycetota bacterium]